MTVEARKLHKTKAHKPSRVIQVKLTPRGMSSSNVEGVLTAKAPKPKIVIKISKKRLVKKKNRLVNTNNGVTMTTSYTY